MAANNLGLALQGLGAGIQGRGGAEFNAQLMAQRESDEARAEKQKQERLKTFYMDSMSALNFIANKQPDQAAKIFFERSELLHQVPGADPIDSDTMAQLFMMAQSGDEEAAQRIVDTLGGIVNTGVAGGYINAPPQQPKPYQKVEGGQVIRERDDGSFYATDIEGYRGGEGSKEFLKEERASANKVLTSLKKRASTINSSYGKIEQLVPQIKKGGPAARAASGAAIMSLARLVSPGVVTDADFRAMSGAADPLAVLMDRVQGREGGEELISQLQRAYDPTNPNLIDADGLLSIAQSLVGAEAPSILQEYSEADSRARRSGMSETAYSSIFGDSKSITGLSRFVEDKRARITPQQIQNIATKTGKSVEQVTQDLKAKGLL